MRLLVFAALALLASAGTARAACVDLSKQPAVTVTGQLTREIFPGPPNFEDVRRGDRPEPAFILRLDQPLCVTGDEFPSAGASVSRIHVVDAERPLLAALVGKPVSVTGTNFFGAHTGHHHAPVVMTAVAAAPLDAPMDDHEDSAGRTTVEAFYLALETGDGAAAARAVVPEKRAKGPFSARELTAFYGALRTPLKLLGVEALPDGRFRARYRFTQRRGAVCDGASVVTIRRAEGLDLIAGVRSETGC